MKNKAIHFFESKYKMDKYMKELNDYCCICLFDKYYTQKCIEENSQFILTTDMSSMTMQLIEQGYRIFLHQVGYDTIEIKVGNNIWTNRYIRMGLNIFNLYKGGEMKILQRLKY